MERMVIINLDNLELYKPVKEFFHFDGIFWFVYSGIPRGVIATTGKPVG